MKASKVALITGANKGIGYQTARLLGADHQMTVYLGARDMGRGEDAAASLRGAGIDAHSLQLDVTDESSVEKAAETLHASQGRLDVLVNNAGIAGAGTPAGESTVRTLRRLFETNVAGPVAVTDAMLPLLREVDAARIVMVSSELGSIAAGLDTASPMWALPASIPYPTSKAALNMVTARYAKQLWDTAIKVNAANPGYCATDLNANSGFRTAEQGADVVVHLATLPEDGPSGSFWGYLWTADDEGAYGSLAW